MALWFVWYLRDRGLCIVFIFGDGGLDSVMSWIGLNKDHNPYDLIPSATIKKSKLKYDTDVNSFVKRKLEKYTDRSWILNISIDDAVHWFWPFKMINQYINWLWNEGKCEYWSAEHVVCDTNICVPYKYCVPGVYNNVIIIDQKSFYPNIVLEN